MTLIITVRWNNKLCVKNMLAEILQKYMYLNESLLFCISSITDLALWLQDFNKLTYLAQLLLRWPPIYIFVADSMCLTLTIVT